MIDAGVQPRGGLGLSQDRPLFIVGSLLTRVLMGCRVAVQVNFWGR